MLNNFIATATLLISTVSPFYYKIALYFPDLAEIDHANILCSNILKKNRQINISIFFLYIYCGNMK